MKSSVFLLTALAVFCITGFLVFAVYVISDTSKALISDMEDHPYVTDVNVVSQEAERKHQLLDRPYSFSVNTPEAIPQRKP